MNRVPSAKRGAAWLCLVLLAGGCSAGEASTSTPKSASQSPRAGAPAADGSDAKAILDGAFAGSQALGTGDQAMGSGHGLLQEYISNTLAGTPEDVVSVTFAFTCTGNATVVLKVAVDGKNVPSAAGSHPCDRSVIQYAVEVPKPSPVSFAAKVTGSTDGSFAYAYFTEKRRLP